MPVTKDNYLVGRVVETNYLSSRVLLLNDLNSRIPVTLNQGAQAILSGSGTSNPILEYLPEDYEIIEDINWLKIPFKRTNNQSLRTKQYSKALDYLKDKKLKLKDSKSKSCLL